MSLSDDILAVIDSQEHPTFTDIVRAMDAPQLEVLEALNLLLYYRQIEKLPPPLEPGLGGYAECYARTPHES